MLMIPPPPPRVTELPRGTKLVAGLGHATVIPDLDFETYSEAGYVWDEDAGKWDGPPGAPGSTKGLPVVGAAIYSADPTCEVLCAAYDLKDGLGRRRWRPGMPPPADLFAYLATGGVIEAVNVGFERWIWEHVCAPRMGWPAVHPRQWRCVAAKARAFALPGSLGKMGEVLNLAVQKDKEGARLIKKFCMPQKPSKRDPRKRIPLRFGPLNIDDLRAGADTALIADDYADTQAMLSYNETDIEAEAEASARIPDLEGEELEWWFVDQAINKRGVHIDFASVENCIAVIEQAMAKYHVELFDLCGVDAASKVQQLLGWLHGQGVHMDSLDEEHVEAALTWNLPPAARRVLEIRAAVGSASVKKVFAMRNRATAASRMHDLFIFCGARTGRATGEGPQPTNSPKAGPDLVRCGCKRHFSPALQSCPWCGVPRAPSLRVVEWSPDAAQDAIDVLRHRSLQLLEHVFGDAMHAVAGCIRGLYDAAPGHDLISTDYNSIEAVGLAMLSGEKWRIDIFKTHGKIYEASAATMFKVPFEDFAKHKAETGQHHPLRQKGKVAELACLSPDTQVLTDVGYLAIVDVTLKRKVWDGVEWVSHAGVVSRGTRPVISLDGARMTPDHKVNCDDSWKAASELASCGNTLSRALVIGSANLPLSSESAATASESCALVARTRTSRCSRIFGMAARLGATFARTAKLARLSASTSPTPTWFPTTGSVAGSWAAFPRRLAGATTQTTPGTTTTAPEESSWPLSGARTNGCSSNTWSRFRAGLTPLWKWTGETLTALTRRATSSSLPDRATPRTSEAFPRCNDASPSLSAVYDIAHAGPRNRFTIRTNSGHLIVHNCGYQGWLGAARAFDMPGTDDEIKKDILAWRAASPAIVWLWGGQTVGQASSVRDDGLADRWDRTPHFFGVEGMAISAILNPGVEYPVKRLDGTFADITFVMRGSILYCILPSGRALYYHNARVDPSERGLAISYEGNNTNPKNGPIGWITIRTWGGRLVENCIAEGTLVLTSRGWVSIERVRADDLVHDGVEFVRHAGIVDKGAQSCIPVDHVWMTPDHEVLTDNGWRAAATNPRPYRPTLRDAGGAAARQDERAQTLVGVPLRLRSGEGTHRGGREERRSRGPAGELRLPDEGVDWCGAHHARDEQAPGVRGVAINERSLSVAVASGVGAVWRARHSGLRTLARVARELLGRRWGGVPAGSGNRPGRQRGELRTGQHPLDESDRAAQQPQRQHSHSDAKRVADLGASLTALRHRADNAAVPGREQLAGGSPADRTERREQRVFDILDCGPRSRFVVLGRKGPFIVHNCNQATCRDILRFACINLEARNYPVVLHVYDEIVSEIPEGFGTLEEFEGIVTIPPFWARDWPIRAPGPWRAKRYRKG